MLHHRRFIAGFVFTACVLSGAGKAAADPPDVHFAIFRLDFQTYSVKGVYEDTQPYRKTLPPLYSTQLGNLYFRVLPAGDFGYTKIYSRITGQLIVYAQTYWMAQGGLIEPPVASFTQNYEHGHVAADPTSILNRSSGARDPDSAWAAVKDTDVIEGLAALGDYEVVVYEHFYRVGLGDPTTAEWFVIAFTNPPAPPDVGIEAVSWPKKLVTRNVPVNPEVTLHNFGPAPVSPNVHGLIENDGGVVYEMSIPAGEIEPDSSASVKLPSWSATELKSHTLTVSIRNDVSEPWDDAFSDNNEQAVTFDVTLSPVFRFQPRGLSAGQYPGGFPLDLDADGDIDFFRSEYEPKFFENKLDQGFEDITNRFPALPHWIYAALAVDIDGDPFPEVLLTDYNGMAPLLFSSGGSGTYLDITSTTGLGGLAGYYGARALDADGDGDQDLFLKHFVDVQGGAMEVVLFENQGARFARTDASGLEAHSASNADIVPADLDQDGDQDLILVNWESSSEVFRNDGTGHFSAVNGPWKDVSTYGRSAIVFDPDLDGDPDILLLARLYSSPSLYFRNDSDMTFVDATDSIGDLIPAFTGGVGDLDGNGYPDVVLGDDTPANAILLNEGGHLTKHSELIIGSTLDYAVDVLDVDRDGDLDIISSMNYGGFFQNQGFDPDRRIVDVHLTRLSARREGMTTVLEWALADDANASDFRVYRSTASIPEKRGVSGIISGGKRTYEFVDQSAPSERTNYWIAEVSRTGELNWFGPVSVDAAGLNRLSLSQNRPNPFSVATRIAFSLPERMPVQLSIYNVEGRKVRDLADQVFPQGETAIYWDGKDQQGKATSSGIYYYHLDAGHQSFTHRMIKLH